MQLPYLYTLDSICSFLLPFSNSDVTRSSSKSISLWTHRCNKEDYEDKGSESWKHVEIEVVLGQRRAVLCDIFWVIELWRPTSR